MKEPSVLVIEDHMVFGKALVHLLTEKTHYNIVGPLRSGEEALTQLPNLDIDLAIVDVSLPRMNGIELVMNIREKYPNIRCLILSGHMTSSYVQRALEAGAFGYVLKDDVGGVIEGMQRVLEGDIYLSEALRER